MIFNSNIKPKFSKLGLPCLRVCAKNMLVCVGAGRPTSLWKHLAL